MDEDRLELKQIKLLDYIVSNGLSIDASIETNAEHFITQTDFSNFKFDDITTLPLIAELKNTKISSDLCKLLPQ